MIRSRHVNSHDRGGDCIAGEYMVDRDHRRKPGVGGVGGRETRSGLLDGVVVAVGQQVAELARIWGADVSFNVTADYDFPRGYRREQCPESV